MISLPTNPMVSPTVYIEDSEKKFARNAKNY